MGSLAIQLAKARGAHVITTAGSRNIAFVKEVLHLHGMSSSQACQVTCTALA